MRRPPSIQVPISTCKRKRTCPHSPPWRGVASIFLERDQFESSVDVPGRWWCSLDFLPVVSRPLRAAWGLIVLIKRGSPYRWQARFPLLKTVGFPIRQVSDPGAPPKRPCKSPKGGELDV